LPPIFEISIRIIAEQAFTLRNKIESDLFPFTRWAEALVQRTSQLSSTWPVYCTLTSNIEQWYRTRNVSQSPSQPFSHNVNNTPATGMNKHFNYSSLQKSLLSTTATENGNLNREASLFPLVRRNTINVAESDYTSSILGITIPVDGQYMTPKDTTLENPEPPFYSHYQSGHNRVPSSTMDIADPASELDAMLHGSPQPHPPTPDSSVSNPMAPGDSAATNEHSIGSAISNNHTSSSTSENKIHSSNSTSLDAIFKDLAYLDTTEWATSREAGLKDFGFIDDTTFQEFCHDPDRLAGSQPLVHPPSIADIWPPPGFFPETFRDVADEIMEC
jgi:hypothetical protein